MGDGHGLGAGPHIQSMTLGEDATVYDDDVLLGLARARRAFLFDSLDYILAVDDWRGEGREGDTVDRRTGACNMRKEVRSRGEG